MKKNYLLPHKFKLIGLVMLVPFLAACIWLLLGPGECDLLFINVPVLVTIDIDLISTGRWFGITRTDPVNEICMLGLLVSLVFIALSKEKDEDEMIDSIRRRSIAVTAFIAFGFFMVINLMMAFLHGFRSLESMSLVTSLVTVLTGTGLTSVNTYIILYLFIFRISIWKMRRQCKEDAE